MKFIVISYALIYEKRLKDRDIRDIEEKNGKFYKTTELLFYILRNIIYISKNILCYVYKIFNENLIN